MAREIPERHLDRFAVTAAETCSIVAPLSPDDTRQALERVAAELPAETTKATIDTQIGATPA